MTAPALENQLVMAGYVVKPCQTRYSPAGLPLSRFVLEHRSRQMEAGIQREARCRIQVLVCGEFLVQEAAKLMPGTLIRVDGFLSRADHRRGEARLVLHATCIEILEPSDSNRG